MCKDLESEYVMGFEFPREVVQEIRRNDTAMVILMELRTNGVAIFKRSQLNEAKVLEISGGGEYWRTFCCDDADFRVENDRLVCFVVYEIEPIQEF
jgi:hypothetical protein